MTQKNRSVQGKQSRRTFFQTTGLGAASLVGAASWPSEQTVAAESSDSDKPKFQLGLASYTTRKLSLDESLAICQRLALKYICLKSFHLAMDATPEVIAQAVAKTKKAGVELYGGGVIYMKNADQVHQAFEYAKAAGMKKIVGVPVPEFLPLVNEKVQKYDIEVCIHNHGPGDKIYPTPLDAYKKIKKLDKRIGLCVDVGHVVRAGASLTSQIEECADRVLDVHLKDVTEPTKKGRTVAVGRGVIDIPALLRKLIEIGYSGIASFEYESDPDDPMPGLAESVGYVRGVLATL